MGAEPVMRKRMASKPISLRIPAKTRRSHKAALPPNEENSIRMSFIIEGDIIGPDLRAVSFFSKA